MMVNNLSNDEKRFLVLFLSVKSNFLVFIK